MFPFHYKTDAKYTLALQDAICSCFFRYCQLNSLLLQRTALLSLPLKALEMFVGKPAGKSNLEHLGADETKIHY